MNKSLLLSTALFVLSGSSAHAWMSNAPNQRIVSRPTATTTTTALHAASDPNNKDPVEMARLRLEMHWDLRESTEAHKTECVIEDPSTCGSDECEDCNGEGEITCRFCRGTKQLYVGQNKGFAACKICQEGHEMCTSCRGTGWIAEWTHVDDKFKKDGEEEYGFGGSVLP